MSEESKAAKGLRLSFLDLISEFHFIEIPLLQRDYAQGRKSAAGVRERFLTSLLDALAGNKPLSLDFVYGEVVNGRFQPIDGQQRLTTLFLLHWLLACAAGNSGLADFQQRMKDEHGEARFRYSVRPSSHRFFLKLLEYAPNDLSRNLAEEIQDQAWFFRAWLHDPTIVGALTMIDAIREKFVSKPGFGGLYQKLAQTNPSPITMDVLTLGSLGLSDEIYIKMNARGKELTGFEKFKAWLIETHENLSWSGKAEGANQWTVLLDVDWLDLFWHFHRGDEKPADPVSKVYFRTFVALAVNDHASAGRFENDWPKADADNQETLWKPLFTQESLQAVFQSLQSLSARDGCGEWPIISLRRHLEVSGVKLFNEDVLAEAFFEGTSREVTLEMRLWLHAICVFFNKEMPAGRHKEVHWFRVVRNLLSNSNFNAENFSNAIKSIGELGRLHAEKGSTLKALQDLADDAPLVGLNTKQLQEERSKARLIGLSTRDSEWEAAIKLAEAHAIFRGQIDLLLPETDDLETFKKRWKVFDSILDKDGSRIAKEEFLLARAVLAHSDKITLEWQKRISLSDSPTNWSALLGRGSEWPQFREGMRRLIDHLTGTSDLEGFLRKCLETPQAEDPWMLDIIRHGGVLLSQSESKKVQNYYANGVFLFHKTNWNPGDVLLGPMAALRNRLIQRLVDQPEARWHIEAPDNRLASPGEHESKVFYKDHHIKLADKRPGDGAIFCRFEYKKLVVGSEPKVESGEVSVPYPENGDLREFHDSLEKESNSGSTNERVQTVLRELSQACDDISVIRQMGEVASIMVSAHGSNDHHED